MSRAGAYLELTKPGITVFVGITAGAGFIAALGGLALPQALVVMLMATMSMSGGAAALNHVAEWRQDALMQRTATRPLPSGVLTVRAARAFGWTLSFTGLALALVFLPLASAVYLSLCHISYVFVYTPLKRRTPFNTLIGAIPGALPVLAGWSATGEPVTLGALALTGVLFMWQIPHFLALGWLARDQYRAAGCPMLGVVDTSGRASARVALAYAVAMLVCAAIVGLATPAGGAYMLVALLGGSAYVAVAWRFLQQRERVPARRLFFASLIVLPALLTALVADLLLFG